MCCTGLSQDQLAGTLFPLWGMEKEEVRALAQAHGLPVAHKGDSMEICFVPDDDHAAFIERYTGRAMEPGDFVDEEGRVLGRHKGIGTVHHRPAQGAGHRAGAADVRSCASTRRPTRVVLGEEGRQMADELTADEVNFLSVAPPGGADPGGGQDPVSGPAAPALLEPAGRRPGTCAV